MSFSHQVTIYRQKSIQVALPSSLFQPCQLGTQITEQSICKCQNKADFKNKVKNAKLETMGVYIFFPLTQW